jgi:2-keto-4-pentenoate hydratase/2-oxohepta-3-ene-1,7-dioic acid hydratase in catechol pathway
MKLFNYTAVGDDVVKLGAQEGDDLVSITDSASEQCGEGCPAREIGSVEDAIAYSAGNGVVALAEIIDRATSNPNKVLLDEAAITFSSPVRDPEKIICVGLNYRKHADETGSPYPKVPIYFAKYSNAINYHGGEIKLRPVSVAYDYEAELTVVIGKECSEVSEDDALDYVFGYTCGNDFSCRDLQFLHSQWTISKSMDGFAPLGPVVATADSIDGSKLDIATYVNGEKKQDSNTNDLIFDVKYLISDLSKRVTLKPGDVILTGTPSGVIMGYPEAERVWLKAGDVVDIEIEGIGSLRSILV